MRSFFLILLVGILLYSCSTTRDLATQQHDPYDSDTLSVESDTIRIANDTLEYEILIIDPGFSYFLNAKARPEGYHSLAYLENKNRYLVLDYNTRVRHPFRYNSDIYTQEINYDPQTNYGYEVNYKLYNYFVYLSDRYNQKFSVSTRI